MPGAEWRGPLPSTNYRAGARRRIPVIERLTARSHFDGCCWIWEGSRASRGGRYGAIRVGGQDSALRLVHVVSYEHFVGPIPEGLQIDHLCRNQLCWNPLHLEAVTPRLNMLRAEGFIARRAAQTECIHGHPFDAENTMIARNGTRQCRACGRESQRRRRAREAVR